ncbi:MAG: tryptophan--tRNA ligase [Candidatus Micrarchaeia archaeon]
MKKKYIVTPWEVSGEVDYDKLIKEFGIKRISESLLERIKRHTKELHPFLRRRIFFAHRDLDWILDEYEKGNKFYLYTGRGPSGDMHLGHLIPMIFTQWLQEKFDTEVWFQMTDDEKFYFKEDLTIEETNRIAYENALDVIALGFKEGKTYIFSDFDYAKTLYKHAALVAKELNFSTVKAVFGLNESSNVGKIFFTSMQSVPAFLPSIKAGKNIPCLIPHAVDQDPHFRISRDILPKLGFYKPASIQSIFLPGLAAGKMSSSVRESAIFITDSERDIERKVANAFTGGRATLKEQREKGGNPDICSVYTYFYLLFMPDDKEIENLREKCKSGEIICGECKKMLAERIKKFIAEHKKKREEAKKKLDKFIIKD